MRVSHLPAFVLAVVLLAAAASVVLLLLRASRTPARLRPWHTTRLQQELSVRRAAAGTGLDEYLAAEQRLFAELERVVGELGDADLPLGRYRAGGRNDPSTFPVDWNRSFELRPAAPRAAALLLHGLTDSPYSVRAIGEVLLDEGFHVLGLRLPGHGTLPASLADVSRDDWRAAVRIGARHLCRDEDGRPFWIVGYSNGAALALDHALAAIDDDSLGRPSRLVLLSPAVEVTRLARLARWHHVVSWVPALAGLRWHSILPEHDPFKYNSFPNDAGYQTFRLTSEVRDRLRRRVRDGGARRLPPILAFQSAADATVHAPAVIHELFERLAPGGSSELIVFDVNRVSYMRGYFATDPVERLRRRWAESGPPFRLTLVTNADGDSLAVVARTWQPGSVQPITTPLDLAWPSGVFSLSHLSVPFPPDDPVYGDGSAVPPGWGVPLGSLEPRGERELLAVPIELFTRLRFNPFFPYLEQRLRQLARDDG